MKNRKLTSSLLALCAMMPAYARSADIFSDISPEEVTAEPGSAMPEIWTFDDCVDWAVNNNTDIRKSLLSILLADEDIKSAKDAWLPTVGFSTNHSFTNYPSPDNGRNNNAYGSSYNANASWTVWEGNIRKYRLESAKIMRQQELLAGDDIVKELKLSILQLYLNIMYAREAVEIARQTLEVSAAQTERARRLMESGRTSQVDYAQIESQAAQDRYNLVQAESNLASSKMNLKKILNLGLDYDIEIADVTFSDSDVATLLPDMADVYASAAMWLPQFKRNALEKDVYANDIKIARAGHLPSIALQGGVGTGYTSGGSSWSSQMKHGLNEMVGLTLTVPIFDGNSTKRAVAKARLSALNSDINRRELRDNLSQTIENLYIESANSRAKYESGLKQLESAELTARLVDRQFELGLVNPLELLTAHNSLLNARLELLQNKFMAILSNKTINYYATQEVAVP